jgi:hypothetical protein
MLATPSVFPSRLPTAAFQRTPVAPIQSRRPSSSCLLESVLAGQPPAPLQSPARDATVHELRLQRPYRERRRTPASSSARCTPDLSLPSCTPSAEGGRALRRARAVVAATARCNGRTGICRGSRPLPVRLPLLASHRHAFERFVSCSELLPVRLKQEHALLCLQTAVNTFRPPFQRLCSVV